MNDQSTTERIQEPREAGKYRCTYCGGVSGWHGMLVRNGIRENCASCLPRRALVGTMERIDIPTANVASHQKEDKA